MNINSFIKSATVAALFGASVSAFAASITISTGDIILGFQDATKSVQLDLGNVSPFLNASDGSTHLIGNVNTVLSWTGSGGTGYGASWASNSGITWGVAGKDASNFYTGFRQIGDAPLNT